MDWKTITTLQDLDKALEFSFNKPVLLFKHSTRCSISATALNRLERGWGSEASTTLQAYFLDLITHRDVSNAIADKLGITHESPQALVVVDGQCVFDASHLGIAVPPLVEAAKQNLQA